MTRKKSRSAAPNLWNQPDVPHKGWTEIGQIDVRDQGAMHPSEYATCGMCGQIGVRYVRGMKHPRYPMILWVGRVCASKLVDRYVRSAEASKPPIASSAGTKWESS